MGKKDTQRYEVNGAVKDFDFMVFRDAFDAKLKKSELNETILEEAPARATSVEAARALKGVREIIGRYI